MKPRLGSKLSMLLRTFAPQGLYARSLIIVIAPILVLQIVLSYIIMDRHWQSVSRRLSAQLAQSVGFLVLLREDEPRRFDDETLIREASERFNILLRVLPAGPLPAPAQEPFFFRLDTTLETELKQRLGYPFWVDAETDDGRLEIRVQFPQDTLQIIARRSQASLVNVHVLVVWMAATSLLLALVSILFLRNQIKPVLALAEAAEAFGKGQDSPGFKIRGAREVRVAARAFLEMRRRIERQLEQRTIMLAGVSHDLRTMLTRMRLSLALMPKSQELDELTRDVDQMGRMLEGYLSFAKGDADEAAVTFLLEPFLEDLQRDLSREFTKFDLFVEAVGVVTLKRDSLRRLLVNLLSNAARYGRHVALNASYEGRWLLLHVDDDGPGIPDEQREDAFRPFVRLDEARNLDDEGTGLGLAIARDIARSHGGDIVLSTSPMGGLRASVRLPY